jgi:hypothetical protein
LKTALCLAAAIVVSLAVVGCAGDLPRRSGPPTAAPPALDPSSRSLGSGVVNLSLDPGRPTDLDPIQLATSLGITPPACDDFVMSFTWQVQTAGAADAPIGFTGQRQEGSFLVGAAGPSGSGAIGCALLEAVNQGQAPVSVQLRFTIGRVRH